MKEYRYPSPVIAERIQQVFDENKISDRYVARILNVDRKTIFRYRHAETDPSIKFIRWICSKYHIDVSWLLDLQ